MVWINLGVLVQTFVRGKLRRTNRAVCDYAAITAVQMAGIMDGLAGSFPILNCCFLIFAASSIPLIVTAAVWNRLKPSIGRIRCFTWRWSCSIPLFRYLLERTRIRFGIFRSAFNSRTARCDAA
jgi:hypothetical protein